MSSGSSYLRLLRLLYHSTLSSRVIKKIGSHPPTRTCCTIQVDSRTRGSLSSEYGTCKTAKARFWPWFKGQILILACRLKSLEPFKLFLFSRTRGSPESTCDTIQVDAYRFRAYRFPANMAHVRQQRKYSGLGVRIWRGGGGS